MSMPSADAGEGSALAGPTRALGQCRLLVCNGQVVETKTGSSLLSGHLSSAISWGLVGRRSLNVMQAYYRLQQTLTEDI